MNKLLQVLSYFPYVLASVKAVEDTAGSLPGMDKKSIVLNSVVSVAKIGEQIPESHVQLISSLIDSVVSALNASGVFAHRQAATVTIPAGVK